MNLFSGSLSIITFRRKAKLRRLACLLAITVGSPAGAEEVRLSLPLDCVVGHSCAIQHYVDRQEGSGSKDYRCGTMTYNDHNGTDFRLPSLSIMRQGVDVRAAAGGRVLRMRDGSPDVSVRDIDRKTVKGVECGNGLVIEHSDGYETQYCHLAKDSIRVRPGQKVQAGDTLAKVGLSGDTEFPHLHFTVRKNGHVIDPFAPSKGEGETCGSGTAIWAPEVAAGLSYVGGQVLNSGFAAGTLTMEDIAEGSIAKPVRGSAALVAYVLAIGLRAGDVQHLALTGPDGKIIAEQMAKPLARNKAQQMLFVGRKRRGSEWAAGTYHATYKVARGGETVILKSFETRF